VGLVGAACYLGLYVDGTCPAAECRVTGATGLN